MTVINIGLLPTASFKDIEFHYQEGTTEGGRKKISHEYPGRKERFVEDVGGLEKKFIITAWTDDNVSFGDRDSLIEVLEEESDGVLIHPTFGEQFVSCIGYTAIDSIAQLGVTKFTINFEVASLNKLPEVIKGNKGFLANLKSKILGNNESKFDAAWKSVKKNKTKFDSAVKTLKKGAREINRVSRIIQGSANSFSDLTTSLNQLVNSANSLVQSPSKLASNLRLAFDNLSVGYNNSKDVFNTAKNLFGFNQRDRQATGNSQLEQDIKANQDALNNFIATSAMALAYNAAADIDFKTLDELNLVNSELEAGFALLPTNIDRDIYKDLLSMRIELNNIFSNLAISLPNIINYEVANPQPLNVLVYSLYGSLDLKETIRELNQFGDTSQIYGTIKILSNV